MKCVSEKVFDNESLRGVRFDLDYGLISCNSNWMLAKYDMMEMSWFIETRKFKMVTCLVNQPQNNNIKNCTKYWNQNFWIQGAVIGFGGHGLHTKIILLIASQLTYGYYQIFWFLGALIGFVEVSR